MIKIPLEPNCTISFLIYLIFHRFGSNDVRARDIYLSLAWPRATIFASTEKLSERQPIGHRNIDSERGNLRCIAVIKRNGILHDTLMIVIWRP